MFECVLTCAVAKNATSTNDVIFISLYPDVTIWASWSDCRWNCSKAFFTTVSTGLEKKQVTIHFGTVFFSACNYCDCEELSI